MKSNDVLAEYDYNMYVYYGFLSLGIGMIIIALFAIVSMISKNKCISSFYCIFIFIGLLVFITGCTLSFIGKSNVYINIYRLDSSLNL